MTSAGQAFVKPMVTDTCGASVTSSLRPYADNVVIVLEPLERETASGLAIVRTAQGSRGHRTARVIASGPGYRLASGAFVENQVKPGDRVIVDALAGQNYDLDLTVPRHNKSSEFQELFGERGEFRIVREQEILGVLEEG